VSNSAHSSPQHKRGLVGLNGLCLRFNILAKRIYGARQALGMGAGLSNI
jgi:hypothetical protein